MIGADVGELKPKLSTRAKLMMRIVEVAPIYDNPGETTALAAAEVAYTLMSLMVNKPVKS